MTTLQRYLDRFYALLARLEALPLQGRPLGQLSGRLAWPSRGVYFFREPGETRKQDHHSPRVVRVGTHAVSAGSKSKLWGRLRAHRGTRIGSGNHRSSIFRLHVGAAMLSRERGSLPTWGQPSLTRSAVRRIEADLERRVSAHIGSMPVLWVDVPGEPGTSSARAYIEKNAIALLSNDCQPVDCPSDSWLGNFSPQESIRRSALWNLNHVKRVCDVKFLDALEECIMQTCDTVGTA